MHFRARTVTLVAACWLGATSQARGQTPARLDSLARALTALSARVDSLEAGRCPAETPLLIPRPSGDPRTDSLNATVRRLDRRLTALRKSRCPPGAPIAQPADTSDDLAAIRAAAAEAAGQAADDTSGARPPAQPSAGPPGANLLNPEISVTGDVRLVAEEGARSNAVGREFEFAFQSALDPFSNTKIFVAVAEEGVEIEEGFLYWTGLPGRVRLDAG